jgi:hypothetical protein
MTLPTIALIVNGTDVSADVEDAELIDRCFDNGMATVKITLNNRSHVYSDLWPAFGETGLYYPGVASINGVAIARFRFEGIDPQKAKGNTIVLDGMVIAGNLLQKQYLSMEWTGRNGDDAIKDIVDWANSCSLYAQSVCSLSYTSSSEGEPITYKAQKEYAHDIIRKFMERLKWTGTLRGTSDTLAALDVFEVGDALHRHTTIITDADIVTKGRSPRDIKESPNILEVTGGKSTHEPDDQDAWTEQGTAGHWRSLSGYGTIQMVKSPVSCGTYALAGAAPTAKNPADNPFIFELDLKATLAEYFNAQLRKMQFVEFNLAIDRNMRGPGSLNIYLGLEDSHGTRVTTKGTTYPTPTGPTVRNQYQKVIFNIGPDSTQICIPSLGYTGLCQMVYESYKGVVFDWTKVAKLRIILESVNDINSPYPITYYIDCFTLGQNYVPTVRVVDSARVAKYDPRMQPIEAPEYTESTELQAYALALLRASATPTYLMDVEIIHDPATELLKAGWQVRFDSAAFGVTSSVWWRLLEVGWLWSKTGLIVHLVAIPASSGSADFSYNMSARVWTKDEAGLYKNIIDAIRVNRVEAEQFSGPTVFTGGTGFKLICSPCSESAGLGLAYDWAILIRAESINGWIGEIDLAQTNNLPAGLSSVTLDDDSLTLSSNAPGDSTILHVNVSGFLAAGTHHVKVTGTNVNPGTGEVIEQAVSIDIVVCPVGMICAPEDLTHTTRCQDDSDCADLVGKPIGGGKTLPYICVGGECVQTCRGDFDCPPGCKCVQIPGKGGLMACDCGDLIADCANVELGQNGTAVAEIVSMQLSGLPGTYLTDYSISVSVTDVDWFFTNGDWTDLGFTQSGSILSQTYKFKDRGNLCGKHFKFKVDIAVNYYGNGPNIYKTCYIDVVICCCEDGDLCTGDGCVPGQPVGYCTEANPCKVGEAVFSLDSCWYTSSCPGCDGGDCCAGAHIGDSASRLTVTDGTASYSVNISGIKVGETKSVAVAFRCNLPLYATLAIHACGCCGGNVHVTETINVNGATWTCEAATFCTCTNQKLDGDYNPC